MNKTQIENYFTLLGKLYPKKCRIILTGAAAGALYGRVRPTMDVDFSAQAADWENFSKAVEETSRQTGIAAQYAEDIDRWSSITLLDYADHTYSFGRYGQVELRLMEPPYWAIGKLSRYLDSDIQDIVRVFKITLTSWKDVAKLMGKALRLSPKSTGCILFRRQVEDFLNRFGGKIWGPTYDSQTAIQLFRASAGIKY